MDCVICNKRIKYPKNWIRHINSKAHIRKSLEQNENNKYSQQNEKNIARHSQNIAKNSQKHSQGESINNIYGCCKYCDKQFKHQSSLSKHQKYRCKVKKEQDKLKKENEELKKLLLEAKGVGNTTNNNSNNTTNNNTTNNNTTNINNTIVINSFGNESIDFSDDFLYAISSPDLSIQDKRLMLQNEIYSIKENKSLVKTNLRDTVMYKHDNGWKAISERLAIRQRIDNTPKIYKTNAKRSILNQYDPDMTEKDKQLEIDEHNNIANEMMKTKPTEEEYKELSETIRLDSYNARDVKLI